MSPKRYIMAVSAIVIFALIWNGFVHLLILQEANSAINALKREDSSDMMGLSILLTVGIAVLYVFNYAKWIKQGTLMESITHGIFFALLAGLLVDMNQYLLYPLPASLAVLWFLAGLVEFSIYGLIANAILQPGKVARS